MFKLFEKSQFEYMILHFLKLIFVSEFLLSKSDLKILNFLISVALYLFSNILANLLVANISSVNIMKLFMTMTYKCL
jgi:hypothetical protein